MYELVTITCNRDIDLTLIHLKTIDKFVTGISTVHVVINETETNDCFVKISSLDLNCQIKCWTQEEILGKQSISFGWISQQLCKLLIPLTIDFVVLDAKDLFVRDIKITDLAKNYSRKDVLVDYTVWKPMYEKFLAVIGNDARLLKSDDFFLGLTPKLIRKNSVEHLLSYFESKSHFIEWFLDIFPQSEFLLVDAVDKILDNIEMPRWPEGSVNHLVRDFKDIDKKKLYELHPERNDRIHIIKIHGQSFGHNNNQKITTKFFKNLLEK